MKNEKWGAMSTKQRLAQEMSKAGCPLDMVERAERGYYDDFESPLTSPIVQLVTDLVRVHQMELANRARDGEFDGTAEEAEAWMEKEGLSLGAPWRKT